MSVFSLYAALEAEFRKKYGYTLRNKFVIFMHFLVHNWLTKHLWHFSTGNNKLENSKCLGLCLLRGRPLMIWGAEKIFKMNLFFPGNPFRTNFFSSARPLRISFFLSEASQNFFFPGECLSKFIFSRRMPLKIIFSWRRASKFFSLAPPPDHQWSSPKGSA